MYSLKEIKLANSIVNMSKKFETFGWPVWLLYRLIRVVDGGGQASIIAVAPHL